MGKLTPFPKYRTEDKIVSPTSDNKPNNPDTSWSTPMRYHFRPRNKQQQQQHTGNISLTNRYSPLMNEEKNGIQKATSCIKPPKIQQINQVVHNISEVTFNTQEMSLLEKCLNFCPSSNDINKEELPNDIFLTAAISASNIILIHQIKITTPLIHL